MITRRALSALLLAPPVQLPEAAPPTAIPGLPIDPADRQELAREGKRASQQAGWLQELPLEGVAPGFVFLVR